tara:strand:+ start:979 stop:1341 length:363 start_codon:yes stop_codon:yes gene_type:complete
MPRKLTKEKCSWYELKKPELSSRRPNFKVGDLLVFRRKIQAWVNLEPTHEVKGRGTADERPQYRGNHKSFPKGTIALVMGEELYQHPSRLIPDLVLCIGDEKVWFDASKVHHLSRLGADE